MADVTLRHVYKVYDGGVRAVNDFDLEIKDKEFVVLNQRQRIRRFRWSFWMW